MIIWEKIKMELFEKVTQNSYGFFEVLDKPDPKELSSYYQKKYFKNCNSYNYSLEGWEIEAKKISAQLLLLALKKIGVSPSSRFFEIGFGEGFLLDAALKEGYDIKGVDFSSDQIHDHNERIKDYVDSSLSPIDNFLSSKDEIHVLCLKHVVEHLINPIDFIRNINSKLLPGSVIAIEVPNDFSVLQKYLIEHQHIHSPYWVCPPDHLAYFTEDSLISLCSSFGFIHLHTFGSFPVEVFLLGHESNYKKYPNHGKSAHQARCLFDSFLFETMGIESLYSLYSNREIRAISRSITCIFKTK